jgi:hypothetical protein
LLLVTGNMRPDISWHRSIFYVYSTAPPNPSAPKRVPFSYKRPTPRGSVTIDHPQVPHIVRSSSAYFAWDLHGYSSMHTAPPGRTLTRDMRNRVLLTVRNTVQTTISGQSQTLRAQAGNGWMDPVRSFSRSRSKTECGSLAWSGWPEVYTLLSGRVL